MSWAKDEWKDGLTGNVLKNITELERHNERLLKDNKQRQFQLDSLDATLQKQKKLTEEERSQSASLKRDIQSLTESCQELERNRQKSLHELQTKDSRISILEGQLGKVKQTLETESAKTAHIKAEFEKLHCEHNQDIRKFEKQTAEFGKLQEASNIQRRHLQGKAFFWLVPFTYRQFKIYCSNSTILDVILASKLRL